MDWNEYYMGFAELRERCHRAARAGRYVRYAMRNLHCVDEYRVAIEATTRLYGYAGDETCGVFSLPFEGARLMVVASSGEGWDHVSVSHPRRIPNWREMEFVKRKFFADDETAMQLHVPPSDHVDIHPRCLHLWRPNDGREIPRPPGWMVGPSAPAAAEFEDR